MSLAPSLIRDLLHRAAAEEMGVAITTNNPQQITMRIHEYLRNSSEKFDLTPVIPSTPDTVFLIKNSVELNEDPWEGFEGERL